ELEFEFEIRTQMELNAVLKIYRKATGKFLGFLYPWSDSRRRYILKSLQSLYKFNFQMMYESQKVSKNPLVFKLHYSELNNINDEAIQCGMERTGPHNEFYNKG
ncbi:unnamed protein product, partial [Allacma fusca]